MPQTLTLTRATTHSPLALWHLLSLDAPTVAALWLFFVAHTTRTPLPPCLAPAMFLAVWIIYAVDRLLDATNESEQLEARHHFHYQHRHAFLATIVVATLALSALLFQLRLPPAYFPLAGVFLAWFAAVHFARIPLPKELATGVIFAAAIFAPELPHHWAGALVFALLCTLNGMWINRWESGNLTRRYTPQLTAALLLLALHRSPVTAAIALAAAALLALNYSRQKTPPDHPARRCRSGAADSYPVPRAPPVTPNFDRVALLYRWAEYAALGRVLERTRTHHLPALAGRRQAYLLGDGDGRFTAALLARYPQIQAHAVDLSPRMIALLRARTASPNLRTTVADALEMSPTPAPDLIVTHFFLDCLTQPQVETLIPHLIRHSQPDTLWLVSEFHAPPGPLHHAARLYIRALYLAFRILTGLRVTRVPDYATPLTRAGFQLLAGKTYLFGLLQTTLWQRAVSHVQDPQSNPEPASPSLDAPDPAVFHHDVRSAPGQN